MRLYRRSKEWDLMDTVNRCYFDADHGRIKLALDRLKDLETELGEDARISYAEGLLRKDFLGQGLKANECFVKALDLDPNHALAACNAAVYAPGETEFRKWGQVAARLSLEDAAGLRAKSELFDQGILYGRYLLEAGREEKSGNSAAYIELGLLTAQLRSEEEVDVRRARAQRLRMLDNEAAHHRETMVEDFPPNERLALSEAITEIDRAIALDEYDAELWNLKSAWCYLMGRYTESIDCADQAIDLRPKGYCRPHQNKAMSLWQLERKDEALACLKEAVQQAESGGQQEDIPQLNQMIEEMGVPQHELTLAEIQPMLAQIVRAAQVTADQEIGLMKTIIQDLEVSFRQRIDAIQPAPDEAMAYVPAMAQALAYISPETCFSMVHEIAKKDETTYENCMRATLYIAAHAEAVMQRDALRLLVLTMFVPALRSGYERGVRELYRQSILEVSASATDEMAQLDQLMRQELTRIAPALPDLIADQEPVDDTGKVRAKRNILAKLQGTPFINDSSNFGKRSAPEGGGPKIIKPRGKTFISVMTTVSTLIVLARYFEIFSLSWYWTVPIAVFAGSTIAGMVSNMIFAQSAENRLDPGFSSLQQAKALWQSLPDLTPHLWYGKINPAASSLQTEPSVIEAKSLIQKAIEHSPESNRNSLQASVNKAIALQELGLLHRAINEFEQAKEVYQESLGILENLGGVASKERRVLAAYRDTVFRLAELEHALGNSDRARTWYNKSLQVDELLGHDDPVGERITRELLENLKGVEGISILNQTPITPHCYLCAKEGHIREMELIDNIIVDLRNWDKPWSPTQNCYQCANCGRLTCYTHCDNRKPCECGAKNWQLKMYLQKELDND